MIKRLKDAASVLLRGRPAGRPKGTGWFQRIGTEIERRGLFVGCPIEVFELTAKDMLTVALAEGLRRDSAVLEVGCGCLRAGYWFIRYLDPNRYCGIEPSVRMLDAGRELLLRDLPEKQSAFHSSDQFEFEAFNRTFDFVVAFSIWTHASKGQIRTMLDKFVRTANSGARFIVSFIAPRPGNPDYAGDTWVGISHKSKHPGLVAHDPAWIRREVIARGLSVSEFDLFTTLGQQWLVIRAPEARI